MRRVFAFLRAQFDATHLKRSGAHQSKTSAVLFIIKRSIFYALVLSIALVICLRWARPPTSAVMIGDRIQRLLSRKAESTIRYKWVAWDAISPQMRLAVIASEDQMFPGHWGFDFESIRDALEKNRRGGRIRGASTITQQVAKNLFLWTGRSYLRKGLEAYFTILLELLWPKDRILEVYLNIAEFGDGVYGVCSAAETFLRKSPSSLTTRDAALLAAVLPNPKRFKVAKPSPYLLQRRYWIQRQMEQLGGVDFLRSL